MSLNSYTLKDGTVSVVDSSLVLIKNICVKQECDSITALLLSPCAEQENNKSNSKQVSIIFQSKEGEPRDAQTMTSNFKADDLECAKERTVVPCMTDRNVSLSILLGNIVPRDGNPNASEYDCDPDQDYYSHCLYKELVGKERPSIMTSIDLEKDQDKVYKHAFEGPWLVFLMIKHRGNTKQTTITGISNGSPDFVECFFNIKWLNTYKQTTKSCGQWVLLMGVTGFLKWSLARNFFLILKDSSARGYQSRAAKLISMYEKYASDHGLVLYTTAHLKEEKMAQIKQYAEHHNEGGKSKKQQQQHQQHSEKLFFYE